MGAGDEPPLPIDEMRGLATHMKNVEIVQRRLLNQKLTRSNLRTPADVVAWFVAVQAQDYAGGQWSLGRRAHGVTEADVEEAFTRGDVLRTHILRPTWHFVAAADLRWLIALSAPRLARLNDLYYRRLDISPNLFRRCCAVFERALRNGRYQTRTELALALRRARIDASGLRLAYIMMCAELEAVICSGPRRGKQFTYALFDERVPAGVPRSREESLAELVRRYFASRGPATVHDFVWWSGLTVRDAKAGLEQAKSALIQQTVEGRDYWFCESRRPLRPVSRSAYLLPTYDEFGISYKDRSALESLPRPGHLSETRPFAYLLLLDGRLVGRWRRAITRGAVTIELQPFKDFNRVEQRHIAEEGERHGRFMNLPVRFGRA